MVAGLGKVDRDFLRRVITRNLGARNESVLVGPGLGLDNSVISIGSRRVMVVTADPITIIPSIGMEDSAWLTVHEIASDLSTSGVMPEFAVLDYNLPPSLAPDDFERYVDTVGRECSRLGIAIIAGHTGRYPGADFTVVGGGMMLGTAGEGEYITPQMVREGDEIIMTKGAAIEATSVLSRAFPETVKSRLGKRVAQKATDLFRSCSTFEDAKIASSVGLRSDGVTAMHDATEGGILGALYELAQASRREISIDTSEIIVSSECKDVCHLFGLDPLVTLSEGTLVLSCRPELSSKILRALAKRRIDSAIIGTAGRRTGEGKLLVRTGTKQRGENYVPPMFDPYWEAYSNGVESRWK